MGKGIDCDSAITSGQAVCLVAANYTFVCRYYGLTKSEPLTRDEALMLSSHGLYIVPVWESGNPTDASYFSFSRGIEDGKACYQYAMDTVMQPAGSTIYSAVDYDAATDDMNAIMAYFHGWREAFANNTGNPSHRYYTGVYGSGYTCGYLFSRGYVHKTWGAFAPGWSDNGFTDFDLLQTGQGSVCGLDVDFNTSPHSDAGGFILHGGK